MVAALITSGIIGYRLVSIERGKVDELAKKEQLASASAALSTKREEIANKRAAESFEKEKLATAHAAESTKQAELASARAPQNRRKMSTMPCASGAAASMNAR
jgi:hypothetical protein